MHKKSKFDIIEKVLMEAKLDGHFTYKRLIRNSIFPIIMMIVTSIYTIVDGLFISNNGTEAEFAAINLIWPAIMILASVGFMFGTGGCALVGKLLGEKKQEEADRSFTFIVLFLFAIGVLINVIFAICMEPISKLFGATQEMLPTCVTYGRMLSISLTLFMLQNLFQNFFSLAERPLTGLVINSLSGVLNILLDATFVVGCKMGVMGAALGTIIAQSVGGILPFLFFMNKNFTSRIHFVKPTLEFKAIGQSAYNGLSEFISQVSINIVSICVNSQAMKYIGQDGVFAYGVVLYVSAIFVLVFIGFNIAVAPIISYKYGEQDKLELQNLFKKCSIITAILGLTMCVFSLALAYPMSFCFVRDNQRLLDLTFKVNLIFSIYYLFVGINMFGSSFFTALNNGFVSGLFAIIRSLIITIALIFILPLFMGGDGIWWSGGIAEFLSTGVLIFFLYKYRKRYEYF